MQSGMTRRLKLYIYIYTGFHSHAFTNYRLNWFTYADAVRHLLNWLKAVSSKDIISTPGLPVASSWYK